MARSIVRLIAVAAMMASVVAHADDLAIVGTGDGMEMLQAVADSYNAELGRRIVGIPPSIGSGGAIAEVTGDHRTLGRVARPLTAGEKAQGVAELPIVRIPSAIFAGSVQNWSEVGGTDLRIRVVRREETDSTLAVLRQTMPGWRDLVLTRSSKLAQTTQEAVETVRDIPGAIGFGPFSTRLDGPIVTLRVDGRLPGDDGYPSAVTVSLIYKTERLDEPSKAFIAFLHQPAARRMLVTAGGAPLTP